MEWCVIAAFPNCTKTISFILTLLFSILVARLNTRICFILHQNNAFSRKKSSSEMHKVQPNDGEEKYGRDKQSCYSGTFFCPICPHFSTKKKEDMNYHIAEHHALKDTKLSTMCTVCLEEFASFFSLQQHKRRKHGTSTKAGKKSSEKLKEVLESEESACWLFSHDLANFGGLWEAA